MNAPTGDGLQAERTQLAEVRTALALAVALLALARLTSDRLGALAWIAAGCGVLALALGTLSLRGRRLDRAARMAALTAVVVLLGVVELAALAHETLR